MPRNGSATSSKLDTSRQALLTSEASLTCAEKTSPDTSSAISSPGSADGRSPSVLPNGTMTDLFGQVPARARISLSSDSVRALAGIATCGLGGYLSSESAALSASLVSRLTTRLSGLTARPLTWRTFPTPAGRLLFRLSPSVHGTSDPDFILLPTPTKRDGRTLAGSQPPKRKPTSGPPLAWFVATKLGIFKGRLCPIKVGSLMGYPIEVALCRPTATPSSRKSRQSSSSRQTRRSPTAMHGTEND